MYSYEKEKQDEKDEDEKSEDEHDDEKTKNVITKQRHSIMKVRQLKHDDYKNIIWARKMLSDFLFFKKL